MMTSLSPFLLALAELAPTIGVLAMFALVWGAVRTWRRDRTKAALMVVCALVILGNLLIWKL